MAERFNGRIEREVLGITIDSHHDLEDLLRGFNQAYKAPRQRVLGGIFRTRRRLRAAGQRALEPPSDPCVLPKALRIGEAANEVPQPDN